MAIGQTHTEKCWIFIYPYCVTMEESRSSNSDCLNLVLISGWGQNLCPLTLAFRKWSLNSEYEQNCKQGYPTAVLK